MKSEFRLSRSILSGWSVFANVLAALWLRRSRTLRNSWVRRRVHASSPACARYPSSPPKSPQSQEQTSSTHSAHTFQPSYHTHPVNATSSCSSTNSSWNGRTETQYVTLPHPSRLLVLMYKLRKPSHQPSNSSAIQPTTRLWRGLLASRVVLRRSWCSMDIRRLRSRGCGRHIPKRWEMRSAKYWRRRD
jgi:hypothetical protein